MKEHTRTHTHTLRDTHTHTHTHTQRNTHTDTHTYHAFPPHTHKAQLIQRVNEESYLRIAVSGTPSRRRSRTVQHRDMQKRFLQLLRRVSALHVCKRSQTCQRIPPIEFGVCRVAHSPRPLTSPRAWLRRKRRDGPSFTRGCWVPLMTTFLPRTAMQKNPSETRSYSPKRGENYHHKVLSRAI